MLAKISIIIPTLNNWTTLKSCIVSIYKQTYKHLEIIVVDNASSDNTSENIKRVFPRIKLITLERNTGVTGGRNAGIGKVDKKSKYLLFFDHDMIADKNMLANLIDVAEMDKSYGIITPKIYYFADKKRIWAAGTNINLWTGQVLFRGGQDKGQFERVEEVQVAPAAILVKRNVINLINEFDDRYFVTYEDTDFCFRAKENNFKTIYAPKAIAYHKISPKVFDEQRRLLERSFWIGRNRILFMGEHGKNFYFFLLILPFYILYFTKLSIEQRNFKGLTNYLNGVLSGIVEELISARLMIHLPYTLYNTLHKMIGSGSKTVLDVACGDGKSMGILNYRGEWKVTGVDIYKPYIDRAKQRGVYENVFLGDIRKIDAIFKGKKFDVVFISSVLDHLEKKDALSVVTQAEKLGKKIILSGLPNGFTEKHEPHFWEGDNPYQEHKSSWGIEDFKKRAYIVRGAGIIFLIGHNRVSNATFWTRYNFLIPIKILVSFLENLFSYILTPIAFYFPNISVMFFAVKIIK